MIAPVAVSSFGGQAQGPCRKASGHINFEHFIDSVPEGYRMGSEQGLCAGMAAEPAFSQGLGTCRYHLQLLLTLVSVMEMTASSLFDWPVGGLEPEPSSWTPYPTPSTPTNLGASSFLSPPTVISATITFITSVNRIPPVKVTLPSSPVPAPPCILKGLTAITKLPFIFTIHATAALLSTPHYHHHQPPVTHLLFPLFSSPPTSIFT